MAQAPGSAITDADTAARRPLRIVHCFREPAGGLFRHVRDLCRAHTAMGHAVGIVCDSSVTYDENAFAGLERNAALGITRIPMRRQLGPSDLGAARRVAAAIRTLSPDVLHGHGAKGGAYARIGGSILRASGLGVARIYTPHGGSLNFDPHGLRNRVYFTAERLLGLLTDAFIFVSRYEAAAYAAKVRRPRCVAQVIPNGLTAEEFEPVAAAAGQRPFLYVGMLRDLKGPDVFIEALALLRDRRGAAPAAYIVGDGSEAERCRALVATRELTDSVTFLPARPAREAFGLGRVLVIPSRAESMPYIVLEAAAAGRAMVVTRVGGIPEIFGDQSHRLVAPGDAKALADAMEAAEADPEGLRQATEVMRERLRQTHTVERMAAAIEAVYRTVLPAVRAT